VEDNKSEDDDSLGSIGKLSDGGHINFTCIAQGLLDDVDEDDTEDSDEITGPADASSAMLVGAHSLAKALPLPEA